MTFKVGDKVKINYDVKDINETLEIFNRIIGIEPKYGILQDNATGTVKKVDEDCITVVVDGEFCGHGENNNEWNFGVNELELITDSSNQVENELLFKLEVYKDHLKVQTQDEVIEIEMNDENKDKFKDLHKVIELGSLMLKYKL